MTKKNRICNFDYSVFFLKAAESNSDIFLSFSVHRGRLFRTNKFEHNILVFFHERVFFSWNKSELLNKLQLAIQKKCQIYLILLLRKHCGTYLLSKRLILMEMDINRKHLTSYYCFCPNGSHLKSRLISSDTFQKSFFYYYNNLHNLRSSCIFLKIGLII